VNKHYETANDQCRSPIIQRMITTTNEQLGEKMLKDLTMYTSLAMHYMD
jgi:hypothetical protein